MTSETAWLDAFPQPEAAAVVKFLCETWDTLARARKVGFAANISEPDLTFVLTEYLKQTARSVARLTGRWGQESQGGHIDPETFRITKRYRTDVEYSTDRYDPALRLIFEFKKLNNTESSRVKYYGESGMARFVTGPYGVGDPVALMVGIVTDQDTSTVNELRTSLENSHVRTALAMIEIESGLWFHAPSSLFPGSACFDTDHMRTTVATPQQTIRIAHVFLDFPDLSPARARRKRKAAGSNTLNS